MRPLGLGNGVFDRYMIYFSIIVPVLLLGVKIDIGTSGNCKDCVMSWEGFILLLGFLGLWRGWGWWIGFIFYLGVICGGGGGYVFCGAGRCCGWLVVA
jgi:hypothetical protein